jgi:hypothetical protein
MRKLRRKLSVVNMVAEVYGRINNGASYFVTAVNYDCKMFIPFSCFISRPFRTIGAEHYVSGLNVVKLFTTLLYQRS